MTLSARAAERSSPLAALDPVPALLMNKAVQQELGVDDDQAAKLNSLAQTLKVRLSQAYDQIRDLPENERGNKSEEAYRTLNAYLHQALAAILTPEQVRRFDQIHLQILGTLALLLPRVREELGLTDEQQLQMLEIHDATTVSIRRLLAASGGTPREELYRKANAIWKQSADQSVNLLTKEQYRKWAGMIGKSLDERGMIYLQREPH
jgi:hypothetical protein